MGLKTNVLDLIKGKWAHFMYYQDGNLWYGLGDEYGIASDFKFPVPIADCGSARFVATDKAIIFMRWIRKHKELLDSEKSLLTEE